VAVSEYSTSIDIDAPADIVFEHLVTAEGLVAWMGQHANLEPHPGGGFSVDINGTPIRGVYLEVDPPRRVVLSWGVAGSEDHPPGSSRVEVTLTALNQGGVAGTRVDLVHTGLPDARAASHRTGWQHFLLRLQQAATGTNPGPDDWAPWPHDEDVP
jgi:uncharacterized protein YndB with AHSA1/START domain